MVQAFIYFWSGDKIANVQQAIDYYEIEMGNDYPPAPVPAQGRRLETGFDRFSTRHQQGNPAFLGAELVDDRGYSHRLDEDTRRLQATTGKFDPFAKMMGVNTSDGWSPYVNLTQPHVQKEMKDYAMSIGATCPEYIDPELAVGCEPRSSPHMWDLTFTIYIDMNQSMGISCLKDTVSHILDSNGQDVPDFCDNLEGVLLGVCTEATVEDYFNSLKPLMLSKYHAELDCTDAPTTMPTSLPTHSPTAAPTASPTFRACDPGIVHNCDLSSTYCGVEEIADGSNSVVCACLPGYLDDPLSESSCIATEAPTASPTDTPTAIPTASPTTEPTLAVKPVLNFVSQCNGLGPCSLTSDDMSMCYCTAASLNNEYSDEGAACSDLLDGDITAVTVSGAQVNLAVAGTYTVTYQCSNSAGLQAEPIVRTVTVYDDVCPTCEVESLALVTIEASFPYIDHQVMCSDNLDLQARSASVTGDVDVELTGDYVITYSTTDVAQNTNFHLLSGAACNAGVSQKRTVTVIDSLKPMITLNMHDQLSIDKDIPNVGYGMMQPVMEQAATHGIWIWIGITAPAAAGLAAFLLARQRSIRRPAEYRRVYSRVI
jgi:hypothetical protein